MPSNVAYIWLKETAWKAEAGKLPPTRHLFQLQQTNIYLKAATKMLFTRQEKWMSANRNSLPQTEPIQNACRVFIQKTEYSTIRAFDDMLLIILSAAVFHATRQTSATKQ